MAKNKLKDEVLSRVDVRAELARLGVVVAKDNGSWLDCRCPLHQDQKPSFRITTEDVGDREKGFWMCHAENKHGSFFDLLIEMGRAKTFKDALAWLGVDPTATPEPKRKQAPAPEPKAPSPPVVEIADIEHGIINLRDEAEARDYLVHERGLSPAIIEELGIGFANNCITIPKPAFSSRYSAQPPQHFKFLPFPRPERKGRGLRFWHSKGADAGLLYPGTAMFKRGMHVPVVESELDAALICDMGVLAVATGGTSHFTLATLAPIYEAGCIPILMPDSDEPGREALAKCVRQIKQQDLEFGVVTAKLPAGCKDVGDMMKECGKLATKQWLEEALSKVSVMVPKPGNEEVWSRLEVSVDHQGNETVRRTLRNLDIILEFDPRWAKELWLNEMGRIRMLGDKPLTDDEFSDIRVEIQSDYGVDWGKDNIYDRVRSACRRNSRSPVREYLEGLAWDGVQRIDSIIGTLVKVAPDQDVKLKSIYMRKFLIGAVARAMRPGCKMDTMLVLYSAMQGIGKSLFAAALSNGWFCDESLRPDDKDCKLALHKHWIIEVSELDATTRRRDLAELRAFISRSEDLIRAPYGRCDELFLRQFAFLGTTNDQGVVKEDDGRRYWPIEVVSIDVAATVAQRDQLWAEAVAAFLGGERWWLTADEDTKRRVDTTERFSDDDLAVDSIKTMVEQDTWSKQFGKSIDDIMLHWKEVGIAVSRKEAPGILRKAGLKNKTLWMDGMPGLPKKKLRRWV